MKLPDIKYCPCTLQPGYTTIAVAGKMLLFGSRTKAEAIYFPLGRPGKMPLDRGVQRSRERE